MIESLLKKFTSSSSDAEVPNLSPVNCSYNNSICSASAINQTSGNYSSQYHELLSSRLNIMRKMFKGEKKTLLDLKVDQPTSLVAHVFKKMKKQESYLKEIEKSEYFEVTYTRERQIFHAEDPVYIEDETGQIRIILDPEFKNEHFENFSLQALTTGLVLKFTGVLHNDSRFIVSRIEFPFAEVSPSVDSKSGPKILLLSGLNIDESSVNDLKLSSLLNFLDHQNRAKEFQSLLLFGGIIGTVKNLNPGMYGSYLGEERFSQVKTNFTTSCKIVDILLSKFLGPEKFKQMRSAFVCPAITDPHPSLMPQKPFSKYVMPSAFSQSRLTFLQNPAGVLISSTSVLILDGLNVRDLCNQTNLTFEESLKLILLSRQLVPTAPNTIDAHPGNSDELILKSFPTVVIVGNSDKSKAETIEVLGGKIVNVVYVQEFKKDRSVVIYDFASKTAEVIEIK